MVFQTPNPLPRHTNIMLPLELMLDPGSEATKMETALKTTGLWNEVRPIRLQTDCLVAAAKTLSCEGSCP